MDWSFENECRFRLFLVSQDDTSNISKFADLETFNDWLKRGIGKISKPKEVCDFDLKDGIIENMDILLGPKTTNAENIIVEALAEKYGIYKKVSKSVLRIR